MGADGGQGRRLIDLVFVGTLTQTREVCMSQTRRLTDELVRIATREVEDAGPMPGFDHFSEADYDEHLVNSSVRCNTVDG